MRWLAGEARPCLVPATALAEACYFIGDKCGAHVEAAFLESFGIGRTFNLVDLTNSDITRMAKLVRQYGNLPLGGTDASIVAVAERLNAATVATVDLKHFSIVAPRHVDRFTLLP